MKVSGVDNTIQSIQGYEIIERIESGGFGVVYRARQQSAFGREVAIKVILPQYANQPDFIRRFEAEAELISRLEHPHIVPLYDYWRDPQGAYLIMRYIRGGSVRDSLRREIFSVERASDVLNQVALALDLAHRNKVVHRDIKPGNILLDESGLAYIADFGIAKDLLNKPDKQTSPESIVGSLDYISPEQARSEVVSGRTDIYSLGVTLYEMIVGKHPFTGSSSIERLYKHINDPLPEIDNLDDAISASINDVIQQATAKNPEERYATVLDFARAFREAASVDATQPALNIIEQLTLKEHEVLQHLADGLTNRQIAEQLFVTPATVRFHLKNIYKKLGVRTRVQAIVRARDLDLIHSGQVDAPAVSGASLSSVIEIEPDNPYKGLHAFQITDTEDFFGREDFVQHLLETMHEAHPYQRFLAVVGPSGSGKSSVIKAGLIPALWRGELKNSEKWYIVEMLPGTHPLDRLEIALTRVASDQSLNIYEQLQRDERGLSRAADLILPEDDTEILIYIDQFEELFTQCEDESERVAFLNLLHYVVTEPRSRVRVVISLRADYYDKPLHYPAFGTMLRSRIETLLPLGAEGLSKAIMRPAERAGVHFEKGLVSQIVSEMTYHAGALPLLQYALTELFNQREGRLLTHDAYQKIGGATGALASQAESLFSSFDEDAQALTRQLFLRLVTVSPNAEHTRRRVFHSELVSITGQSDLMEEVIDAFIEKRLLASDYDEQTRQPTIEVAHEAILREWDRLREWLEQSSGDILMERRLAQQTELWLDAYKDPSYLLTGARLKTFEDWEAHTDISLTTVAREFLDTSRFEHDALKKVELRRERTLRYLSYGLIGILGIAVIVSTALAFFAVDREREAVTAQQTSVYNEQQARQLAQVNGVYAALAQGQRSLAVSLGLAANLDENPHPVAYQALADAAYPPGTIGVLSSDFEGFDYDNSANLIVTRDGKQLLHPFRARDMNEFRHGLAIYNVDRESPDFGERIRLDIDYETTIMSVSLMPDEQRFIAIEMGGRITMRDFNTFEILHTFANPEGIEVLSPIFFSLHPDGKTAVTNDAGQPVDTSVTTGLGIYVWDIDLSSPTMGQVIAHYTGVHEAPVNQVLYDESGDRIISASMDQTLAIYDASTGEVRQRLRGHSSPVMVGAFNPDGTRIISAGFDGTLIIWDTDATSDTYGQEVSRLTGHSNLILQFAFGPDGKTLFTSGWDGRVLLWNIDERLRVDGNDLEGAGQGGYGTIITEFKVENSNGVALSPDGRTGFTANIALHAWDLYAGNEIANYTWGRFSQGADYRPQGDFAALGTHQDIILLDAITGEELTSIEAHSSLIFGMAFSPDGQLLASAGDDGRVVLWDTSPDSEMFGQEIRTVATVPRAATNLFFSPDGQYLYGVLLTSGTIMQWDVATGEMLRSYVVGSPHFLRKVAMHPQGQMIAFPYQTEPGGAFHATMLYDLATGTQLEILPGEAGANTGNLEFTADGTALVTINEAGTVRVWSLENYEIMQEISTDGQLWNLAIHPDGRRVYVGDSTGGITIIDRVQGIVTGSLEGHDAGIFELEIDPLGRTLLSSAEFTASLWRLDTRADIVNWTIQNRLPEDIPCAARIVYQIDPLCDENGEIPSQTISRLPTETPVTPIVVEPAEFSFTVPELNPGYTALTLGEIEDTVAVGSPKIYVYEGTEGETLSIGVVAESLAERGYRMQLHPQLATDAPAVFDPIVAITDERGQLLTAIKSPDTTVVNYVTYPGSSNISNEDLSVAFEITLPATGRYEIAVSGEGYLTGGAYTLSVNSSLVE